MFALCNNKEQGYPWPRKRVQLILAQWVRGAEPSAVENPCNFCPSENLTRNTLQQTRSLTDNKQ